MNIKQFVLSASAISIMTAISPMTAFAAKADPTIVSGHVYDSSGHPANNAAVTVSCAYEGQTHTLNTVTNNKGRYRVSFMDHGSNDNYCDEGAVITTVVNANGVSGSKTGTVHENKQNIDVSVLNIFVPEFNGVTGALAIAGSVAAFLIIRKKRYNTARVSE